MHGKFYESPWHDLLVVELLAFLNFSKRTAILVKLAPKNLNLKYQLSERFFVCLISVTVTTERTCTLVCIIMCIDCDTLLQSKGNVTQYNYML